MLELVLELTSVLKYMARKQSMTYLSLDNQGKQETTQAMFAKNRQSMELSHQNECF